MPKAIAIEEKQDTERQQYVVFDLGNEEYGLEIELAKEILKPTKITPVPNTKDYVPGVINLRGQIIPVVDLFKRFSLVGAENREKEKIIIVEIQDTMIGLMVDRVQEIVWIDEETLDDPPEVAGGIKQEFLKGVGTLRDELLIIIDINETLFEVENN
ncbi:MAG: chemotaxis protein CheW [Halanaerobiaceae bacterium]